MSVLLAFYRGSGDWRDLGIRVLTGATFSHCELLGAPVAGERSTYHTIGASKRDGNQVRRAQINMGSGHWTILAYHGETELAWNRASDCLGQPYDVVGAMLSASALARSRPGRWFCSELCAYALGFLEPQEFSPGMLAAAAIRREGP